MSGWQVELRLTRGALRLDVAFEVGPGPTAIIGPNGAGKTTLLRAIAGAGRPEGRVVLAGRVLLDSAAGVRLPPEARGVGYVPQGHGLFPHLDALDNVAYGLRGDRAARRAAARAALERLGAAHLADRRPAALSGGEAQRVALARALAVEPAGLLLDEPLAALDIGARRATRALLAELLAGGRPALVVTHDLRDVRALGGEVIVLDAGRVTQRGSPEALAADPGSAFVAEFFAVE